MPNDDGSKNVIEEAGSCIGSVLYGAAVVTFWGFLAALFLMVLLTR